VEPEIQDLINNSCGEGEADSDTVLARLLQMQYDEEHNALLKAQEKHWNSSSKGGLWYTVIDIWF